MQKGIVVEEGKMSLGIWLADFCMLTKRMAFSQASLARAYQPGYVGDPRNQQRHRRGGQMNYAKWSRYVFRKSSYSISALGNAFYDSPVYMFAIIDRYSGQILHACLRHLPDRSKFYHYPVWFDVKPCLREAL